jgi:endonuclease/exonuclease/phosphatase (EEP) superfamily protein YafD
MSVTLRGLLEAAAVLTVLVSGVTLLPFEFHALQLFSHFRLQYLAASVVLLVVFGAWKEPRYALALVAATALNANFVLPWFFDAPSGGTGTDFKVLLANVQASNENHEPLLELIENEQPDLVFVIEVSPRWAESLKPLGARYAHELIEPRNDSFGIAMFSRLPVTSVAAIESSPLAFPTIVAALEAGGKTLNVVATHPTIPLGKANHEARNRQLDGIARLLQKTGGPRLLVGDLNTTMWEREYGALENRTWLRNVRHGFGVLPTWPTFFPVAMIPIDHILVSEEIGVTNVRTGPRIGSDHLPLIATLTL